MVLNQFQKPYKLKIKCAHRWQPEVAEGRKPRLAFTTKIHYYNVFFFFCFWFAILCYLSILLYLYIIVKIIIIIKIEMQIMH